MSRVLPISVAALLLPLLAPPLSAQRSAGVDAAALRAADPTEWLAHGRDPGETYYSPLDQITADNVDRLGLAWWWDIGGSQGRLEATPLVSDGVLYGTGIWSTVFAVDARTGEEIWRWDPAIVRGGRQNGGPSVCCGPVNRGPALYNGKVYAGLLDGRLVALDAETGRPVWVQQTTPVGGEYSITMAPRIANGNVIVGNSGAEYGVRGYVTAYDAETGNQAWRTYTVPGNPALGFESPAMEFAAATWAGNWWDGGGGGTVWDGMAFDPDANLFYIGTGNGAPWSREHRSDGVGDNLYLASILALDADTGEIVWYYQTAPGDDWDYTAVQNMILADIVIDGVERQVLMQAPKNGFFYVLDRITGELLSAEAFSTVTWAYEVDMETGRPLEVPEARYNTSGVWLSPGPRGAHNWNPMSYNPDTGLIYLPGQHNQRFYEVDPDFDPVLGRFNTGIGPSSAGGRPDPPPLPEPRGFLAAIDPATQQEHWRIPHTGSRNGGTMTTAGNLLFSATEEGVFYALDATTGARLWEAELPEGPATPITYELDGRQYVTILSGPGDARGPGAVWSFVLDGNTPIPQF